MNIKVIFKHLGEEACSVIWEQKDTTMVGEIRLCKYLKQLEFNAHCFILNNKLAFEWLKEAEGIDNLDNPVITTFSKESNAKILSVILKDFMSGIKFLEAEDSSFDVEYVVDFSDDLESSKIEVVSAENKKDLSIRAFKDYVLYESTKRALVWAGVEYTPGLEFESVDGVKPELIEGFTKKLKEVKVYTDFEIFMAHLDSFPGELGLAGKRRGYKAYAFRDLYNHRDIVNRVTRERYKDRVDYLYEVGVSTGESHVKNLYKVLRVW